mmetsp:Transcript_15463/g.38967  ORF Transcript_15463/g.38967 Transcript_15463/m.38967 type:complete len:240 (+) Transcript_15463:296-1015(+)
MDTAHNEDTWHTRSIGSGDVVVDGVAHVGNPQGLQRIFFAALVESFLSLCSILLKLPQTRLKVFRVGFPINGNGRKLVVLAVCAPLLENLPVSLGNLTRHVLQATIVVLNDHVRVSTDERKVSFCALCEKITDRSSLSEISVVQETTHGNDLMFLLCCSAIIASSLIVSESSNRSRAVSHHKVGTGNIDSRFYIWSKEVQKGGGIWDILIRNIPCAPNEFALLATISIRFLDVPSCLLS